MPSGVARRRNGVQGARGQVDLHTAGEPLIGQLPGLLVHRRVLRQCLEPHEDVVCPAGASCANWVTGRLGSSRISSSSAGRSPAPRLIGVPERTPHRHRLRVVVAVHVGDEELRHVLEPVADRVECAGELLLALGQRPARVDQHDALAVGDGVDVHRAQPVVGQGQWDAADAGQHLVPARLRPLRCASVHEDSLRGRGEVVEGVSASRRECAAQTSASSASGSSPPRPRKPWNTPGHSRSRGPAPVSSRRWT